MRKPLRVLRHGTTKTLYLGRAGTCGRPPYFARLFGAAPSDREGGDAESSDSSDDDQDRAAKAARATGSTTIPDVAVFQVLAFWLGDAKTL